MIYAYLRVLLLRSLCLLFLFSGCSAGYCGMASVCYLRFLVLGLSSSRSDLVELNLRSRTRTPLVLQRVPVPEPFVSTIVLFCYFSLYLVSTCFFLLYVFFFFFGKSAGFMVLVIGLFKLFCRVLPQALASGVVCLRASGICRLIELLIAELFFLHLFFRPSVPRRTNRGLPLFFPVLHVSCMRT